MKLTILGTGNAAVTECYNTCFLLTEGPDHLLRGPGGVRRRLLRRGAGAQDQGQQQSGRKPDPPSDSSHARAPSPQSVISCIKYHLRRAASQGGDRKKVKKSARGFALRRVGKYDMMLS